MEDTVSIMPEESTPMPTSPPTSMPTSMPVLVPTKQPVATVVEDEEVEEEENTKPEPNARAFLCNAATSSPKASHAMAAAESAAATVPTVSNHSAPRRATRSGDAAATSMLK